MKLDKQYLHVKCDEVVIRPLNVSYLTDVQSGMMSLMYDGKGKQLAVGLAANQVGLPYRIIMVDNPGFRHFMINPVIKKFRGGVCKAQEQCLSSGNKKAHIWRYKIIVVQWYGIDDSVNQFKARGLLARIIQHEVDHLNGIDMFMREQMGACKGVGS